MEIAGRSAIVTGGAGGLGSASVRRLVDAGMKVVIFDRVADPAEALAKELGLDTIAVVGDTTDDAAVQAAILAAEDLGRLTVVVNVAGGGVGGGRTVGKGNVPHDWDAFVITIQMNVMGTFNVCRLAAAAMADNEADDSNERGAFVNVGSIAGMEGQTGQIAYGTAKAGVLGMTLPMARDLAPIGIRVRDRSRHDGHAADDERARGDAREARRADHPPAPPGQARGVRRAGRDDRPQQLPQRREHPPRRRAALPSEVGRTMADAMNLDWLELEPTGEHSYRAQHAGTGHSVVFGGQLLGQMIVAGVLGHEGKTVKTIHTVFACGASYDEPLDVTVDPMHAGRAFASSTVTISQGDRLCCRGDRAPQRRRRGHDPARRGDAAGRAARGLGGVAHRAAGLGVAVVGGIDVVDPDVPVGPAELEIWSRFVGRPADPIVNQALLSFATDGWRIGTAMIPHEGVGYASRTSRCRPA